MRTIIIATLISALGTTALAAEGDDAKPDSAAYREPVLITSVGQAADILIMKGLALRAGLKAEVRPLATADSLEGFATLILVAGGSSKGMGAAKVDVSREHSRVNRLIEVARDKSVPIITFHIGGEARRGALSDPFNRQAALAAERIVVAGDGDRDEFFKKIAADDEAEYLHIDKSIEVVKVLKGLFGKE